MKKNDDSLRNLENTIRIPIYALWEFQKAKSKESLFEKNNGPNFPNWGGKNAHTNSRS